MAGEDRRLREATAGCSLLILCATAGESAPIIEAMDFPTRLVAATKDVLVGHLADCDSPRVALAVSGCDKANAAHTLTVLLESMDPPPLLVLQAGIAGAFVAGEREVGARLGDLALATEEIYSDTGSSSPTGWLSAADLGLPIAEVDGRELGNIFEVEPRLVAAAASILSAETEDRSESRDGGRRILSGRRCVAGPFVTSSRVSGLQEEGEECRRRWGAIAESMEGAAAAHVCALYGVPFLEVRGVSNMVVDRDRASWRVEEAIEVASAAVMALCRSFYRLPVAHLMAGEE